MKSANLIFLLLCSLGAQCQVWMSPSDTIIQSRKDAVITFEIAASAGSLIGLYSAWYSQYESQKFTVFNDWPGWNQMDKIGHAATAYQLGNNLYHMNRWYGQSEKRAFASAILLSTGFQTAVEVMDGFSSGWGFSLTDIASNSVGSAVFGLQQWGWKEQRITMKYSFSPSGTTSLAGEDGLRAGRLFGEGIHEQWLKDYNGQTYWMSANIWSLVGKPEGFPKWINVALGYSANNMLGANSNTWTLSGIEEDYTSALIRERQVLLSLDIDLTKANLPVYLNWVKPIFGVVKLPFPALEWNSERGIQGHWLYF